MTVRDPTHLPSPRSDGDAVDLEAVWAAVLEASPDVSVFVFDADLRYSVVAGGAFSRLGWRAEEIVGRRPTELLSAESGAELEAHMRAALAGEVRQHEHPGIRDVAAVWSSTVAPVRDAAGAVVAGIVISRDVAAVRAAQRAWRESEQRFAVALEAAPVMVFAQDRDLRFTWASKTFLTPTVEEILGRTDEAVLPAESVAATVPAKRAVIAAGVGQRLMFEAPAEDGTRFFDLTLEPTRDEAGQVTGLVGAALEVTGLRTSEQRLRAALESMLDSVTLQHPVRDERGEVVDFRIGYATANALDFANRGRDELVGKTLRELYPHLGDEFLTTYEQVLRTGEPLHVTAFPYDDEAGATKLYDLGVSRVGDMLLVVWRDVTEREEGRVALAHSRAVRSVSEQLQRGLLPPPPPAVAGLLFASTYHPATETAEVGGDWHDVVPRAGDDVARTVDVIVGDVEGHDGEAAALMARLSTLIRADSRRGGAMEDILADLRSFHEGLGNERLATVAIARLDLERDVLDIMSAGHPLPLLRRAGGDIERVTAAVGPPVGAPGEEPAPTPVPFAAGDTLVLFSDGLLDPHADTDDALDHIAQVVARTGVDDLQRLVQTLTEETRAYQPSDDVVVVAVQRVPS